MNKKTLIIAGVTLLVVLVIIVLGITLSRPQPTMTANNTNPVVESYRNNLPELESRVAQNANNPESIRNYAVALYATGDLESAKEQYIREQALNPNDPVLFNNLGNIYRDSGEYQQAVDSYQKSIDLDKSQLNVYVNLANLYIYVLQQPDLGYGVYLKGIENSPNNKEALLLQLANAYRDAGLNEKAIEKYNEILALNPSNTVVRSLLESLE